MRTNPRTLLLAGIPALLALTAFAPGRPTDAVAYRWTRGERRIYRLEQRSSARADLRPLMQDAPNAGTNNKPAPALPGMAQSIDITVRGDWTTTVIERKDDGALVACALENPVVTLKSGGREAESAAIAAALARTSFADVDRRGRVRSVRFDPALDRGTQGFVRSLLGATQFVTPENSTASPGPWVTSEEDAAGSYVARYEPLGRDSEGLAFRKRKLHYRNPAQDASLAPGETPLLPTIQPRLNLLARFDARRGRLLFLRGMEAQTAVLRGKTVARTSAFLSLALARSETLGRAELAALRRANVDAGGQSASLSAIPTVEEIRATSRRSTLGSDTLPTLLAELAQIERSGASREAGTALYLKFRALAYLRPDACAALGKILADAEAGSPTFAILAGALSAVGSPAAQAALCGVIEARPAERVALLRLVPALGLAPRPTPETETLLRRLAFGSPDGAVATTAQLALGSIARTLATSNPDRARQITDLFLKKASGPSSPRDAQQTLLVLGNIGSTRVLPAIRRHLSARTPAIRDAAVCALRFVPSSEADALLTHALAADGDATVRAGAALALGYRRMTPGSFRAQRLALLRDKSRDVRLAVLQNLAAARRDHPEVVELARSISIKDADKAVRKAAKAILRSRAA